MREKFHTALFLSITAFIVFPFFFPTLRIFYFAPCLVTAYYNKPFPQSLWIALLCGLILDLFSAYSHLGIYALAYSITTVILYSQKKHFFEDSYSTLPIMTFLFSVISTAILFILLKALEGGFKPSFEWIKIDLLLLPLLDALYAFLWFTIPMLTLFANVRIGRRRKTNFVRVKAKRY